MARRRHLIAYDIADPRRLRKVCKVMEAYGDRLQYSVFLCDLSPLEKSQWRTDIHGEMNYSEDSVVVIDMGPTHSCAEVSTLGVPRRLPAQGPRIM